MPVSPETARLRGRIGGLSRAAKAVNPSEMTAAGRAAQMQKFLDQVPAEITDPADRMRRAQMLRAAHMSRLALKASAARTAARKAREAAAEATAELGELQAASGGEL